MLTLMSTRCCTLKTNFGIITLASVACKVTEPEKCCPPSVPFNCLVNFEVSECVHPRLWAAQIRFGENASVSHPLTPVLLPWLWTRDVLLIRVWTHLQRHDLPPRSWPSLPGHWHSHKYTDYKLPRGRFYHLIGTLRHIEWFDDNVLHGVVDGPDDHYGEDGVAGKDSAGGRVGKISMEILLIFSKNQK